MFAHFAKAGRRGNARRAVEPRLNGQRELRLEYPITTEAPPPGVSYESLLIDCYDRSAKQIAEVLDQGSDVAVLCEGDPLFYGSYMYLHHRLESAGYEVEVVPGVPAMLAGAAVLGAPLAAGEEMLSILSGVLRAPPKRQADVVAGLSPTDLCAELRWRSDRCPVDGDDHVAGSRVAAAGTSARDRCDEHATGSCNDVVPELAQRDDGGDFLRPHHVGSVLAVPLGVGLTGRRKDLLGKEGRAVRPRERQELSSRRMRRTRRSTE